MKTPTFQEQYNKIVDAYYKNELKPYIGCACFVGNLLNNKDKWGMARDFVNEDTDTDLIIFRETTNPYRFIGIQCIKEESNDLYSIEDICQLEQNFLRKYSDSDPENSLFNAMETTLELLKQIHESKGEIIKKYNFIKRELQP